jgi:hypothetical protein
MQAGWQPRREVNEHQWLTTLEESQSVLGVCEVEVASARHL